MSERKFDKLADLRHLLTHTTDVIIPDVVEAFLILAVDRFAFAENLRIRRDDAVLRGISFNNLELDSTHAPARQERIALPHRSVRFQKVRLQVHVKQVPSHALDGITKR